MVKKIIKIISIISFSALLCFSGCSLDFLGLFHSSDLDARLKERNNFVFLDGKERNWKELNLGDSNEYSFIVITDTHIQEKNGGKFTKDKENRLRNLKNVITSDVKFAVHLGDVTQSGHAEEIDKFIEIADSLNIPVYPVIGNHDVYFNNFEKEWKIKIGSTSYRIDGSGDKSGVTLFILDSANSFFGKEQLDWLERELKYTKKAVFVFTHAPLFVQGPIDMQQITDTKERARIVSILRNKCDIMFAGHSHKRSYYEAGNVKFVTIEDFKDSKAYCVVTVDQGKITYKISTF